MILYTRPEFSPPMPCPYLPGKVLVYSTFHADNLTPRELSELLSSGWRKFGHSFFRPACPGCRACVSLRIPVKRFRPSRSQRRVLKRCSSIRTTFGPLRYESALFDLYQSHSQVRFGQEHSFEDFAASLHSPSCPTLLSRYELDGRLVGAGYLDLAYDGLSSVYFVYDPAVSHLSLGVFSVLREIAETASLGLPYYYLGYHVPGCDRMAYKASFRPHQVLDWEDGSWREGEASCPAGSPGTIPPLSG
jgi:arginine-tRNA-protein transferase